MKLIFISILLFSFRLLAQITPENQKTNQDFYVLVEGDSVARTVIDLNEVLLLTPLKLKNREDRFRYAILKRKTLKVYPYAKLAAERLLALQNRLNTIKSKGQRRRYTKIIQKFIEDEFSAELKKLTITEGQILVKLIHRQTGRTTFDLIKELRSGWRAFWYNSTANLFDISLKREFDPNGVEEDYMIEDILLRAFQSQLLERQAPAFEIDYYACAKKWIVLKTKK